MCRIRQAATWAASHPGSAGGLISQHSPKSAKAASAGKDGRASRCACPVGRWPVRAFIALSRLLVESGLPAGSPPPLLGELELFTRAAIDAGAFAAFYTGTLFTHDEFMGLPDVEQQVLPHTLRRGSGETWRARSAHRASQMLDPINIHSSRSRSD